MGEGGCGPLVLCPELLALSTLPRNYPLPLAVGGLLAPRALFKDTLRLTLHVSFFSKNLNVPDLWSIHYSKLEPPDHLVHLPNWHPTDCSYLALSPKPSKATAAPEKRRGARMASCLCVGSLVNSPGGSFSLPALGA